MSEYALIAGCDCPEGTAAAVAAGLITWDEKPTRHWGCDLLAKAIMKVACKHGVQIGLRFGREFHGSSAAGGGCLRRRRR